MVPAGDAASWAGPQGFGFRNRCLSLSRPGDPQTLPGETLDAARKTEWARARPSLRAAPGGGSSRRSQGTQLEERGDSAEQKMVGARKTKGSPLQRGGEEPAQSEVGRRSSI